MTDAVQVALIVTIPTTIASISTLILGIMNRQQINGVATKVDLVEKNTNDKLTRLMDERNAAVTRADISEGHAAGVASEQDRTKETR